MKSKKGMNQKYFIGLSVVGALILVVSFTSLRVWAVQGDPIPGVDVSVEQNPSGIITSVPANLNVLKENFSASVRIFFDAGENQNGTVTVTFPRGYIVTGAATAELSSPCLSSFAFTNTRLIATKNGCTGTLILAGAVVNTPVAAGTQSSPVPTPTTIPTTPETGAVAPVATAVRTPDRTPRECVADANNTHNIALRRNNANHTNNLKEARKTYNDAIKAAQLAYQNALKKIAAEYRTGKATADASWKEAKTACTAAR